MTFRLLGSLAVKIALILCLGLVAPFVWSPAFAASCRDQVGAARADVYVRECLAISTATHPPCNADNDCATIGGFIQDMCRRTPHAPLWCKAYAGNPVPNPPPPMQVARPGFDCGKAATPVDREICAGGHDWIAEADRRMSELYVHLLAHAAKPAVLRAGQQAFLREREACAAPERGGPPGSLDLADCIGELTHERVDELERLSGARKDPAWSAFAPPCEASFGDDGWDKLEVLLQPGQTIYSWFDLHDLVLRPGDAVAVAVDGTEYPARLKPDEDGALTAVSTDARLVDALRHGRMAWVKRNGKVILRAPLGSFPAAFADAKRMCARPAPR